MPELPEVETVRRGLEALIIGKKVKAATSDNVNLYCRHQNQSSL
jgi:formamidopyrimidine-DNA glycosylase